MFPSSFSARTACCMRPAPRCPGLLQSLFGYDAYRSGLVMSPSGVGSIAMMLVVGVLLGRGVDARYLIAAGLIVAAIGNYWMSVTNLGISPWQVVWPRVVLVSGLGLLFAPISLAAYNVYPAASARGGRGPVQPVAQRRGQRGHVDGQTFQERRDQFHTLRLGEGMDPLNPDINSYLSQAQAFFLQQTGDANLSQRMAWQSLEDLRAQQAASLAYFDVFWISAVLAIVLVPLVLLIKRSVAEKVPTSRPTSSRREARSWTKLPRSSFASASLFPRRLISVYLRGNGTGRCRAGRRW